MSRADKNEYVPDFVSPPGDTLRELLDDLRISQTELAQRTGRPKKTISEIVNGKAAITPDTALQLELVLGTPATFWNTREQHYREYLARKAQEERLCKETRWLRRFPLKKMYYYNWIEKRTDDCDQVRELLGFFSVVSPEQWASLQRKQEVAFRRSAAFKADTFAMAAWLRQGIRQAAAIKCQTYSRDEFMNALHDVRRLTATPPDLFQPRLIDSCARAGVAVTFVPELPKSRASGATRWLSSDRALIQLSLRYKTNDHLWFTFFHEAAHILLHSKRDVFLEGDGSSGETEAEANRFAADFLIPPQRMVELRQRRTYTKAFIRAFATDLGIAPGIVVGRLQHERLLPHTHLNGLKQRFSWSLPA